jgi:hypothetical protein
MAALTFDQMIEERIAAKYAERKAAEERAAVEALEWDLALRESDKIAQRHHKRRKAALNGGNQKPRDTQVVRRVQEFPFTSDHHMDYEDQARTLRRRIATPRFSDSDLKPKRKRRRLGKLCFYGSIVKLIGS